MVTFVTANSYRVISIVVPLFNEEGNVGELFRRVKEVCLSNALKFEIVFVDDNSRDATWNIISELAASNPEIKALSFSRNFGHQVAITAGLNATEGDHVVTMDGDLQHPPELIPVLLEKSKEGYDIVNTLRESTADSGFIKNFTSRTFYKILNTLSDVEISSGAADFRLMSRKASDAFLRFEEKDRFTRGIVSWMGFKQTFVNYEAPARFSGESKFTLKKMFRLATDGITSFSAKPLRLSFYLGLFVASMGFLYAIYSIVAYFLGKTTTGWPSIMISVLLLSGIQLISIGIIGEYIARIFNESKNRPLYLLKDEINNRKTEDNKG